MAKQSGIHQLRGKVGEHSYYRQSGVQGGLVRSINPSMSSRVKTSPEFENTRRNNNEFKSATRAAATMLNAIVPRFRPMLNKFLNARTSSGFLRLIKSNAGLWGFRVLEVSDRLEMANILTAASKNKLSELATISLIRSGQGSGLVTDIQIAPTDGMADILSSYGATGVTFKCYGVRAYLGKPDVNELGSFLAEDITVLGVPELVTFETQDTTPQTEGITLPQRDLNIMTDRHDLSFVYVVAMPYRSINGGREYTLQEACCFCVLIDPDQID